MSSPLLSVLLLYRTPPIHPGSPRRDIKKFFEDLNKIFSPSDVEILIRLDKDDKEALDMIPFIKKQPFTTKVFIYNRWEGRFSFNYSQSHLFINIHPETKFIMTLNDDSCFYIKRAKGILDELKQYKDEKYVVFWGVPKTIGDNEKIELNMDTHYTKDISYNKVTIFSHPIVSKKIIECMGSTGWITFIDDTIGLIIYFLYRIYGVNIVKILQKLVIERKNNYRDISLNSESFNLETQICEASYNPNAYFYELIKQQAKNIYLNMKEDKLI